MVTERRISVSVVLSQGPRSVKTTELNLAKGSTASQAVREAGLLATLSQENIDVLALGIWGRKVSGSHLLRDGDRVELYRPLTVDPKVARRERFAKQGAKSAGLFAKRRAGAKAGY